MRTAAIPSFNRACFKFPARRRFYNGDIYLEAYRPTALTFSGSQRQWVHETLDTCLAFTENSGSSEGIISFRPETPLPKETIRSAISPIDLPPDHLIPFWYDQLSATSALVGSCELAQSKRGDCAPSEISPATGKFQTVATKQLTDQHGLGGSRWLYHFAFCFPITGHLSQKHLFGPGGRDVERMPPAQLYEEDRPPLSRAGREIRPLERPGALG